MWSRQVLAFGQDFLAASGRPNGPLMSGYCPSWRRGTIRFKLRVTDFISVFDRQFHVLRVLSPPPALALQLWPGPQPSFQGCFAQGPITRTMRRKPFLYKECAPGAS